MYGGNCVTRGKLLAEPLKVELITCERESEGEKCLLHSPLWTDGMRADPQLSVQSRLIYGWVGGKIKSASGTSGSLAGDWFYANKRSVVQSGVCFKDGPAELFTRQETADVLKV